MNTSTRLLIVAGLLALLTACGNKGPLVLPSPPADSETPVPAAPPSTDPAITLPPEHPTPPADTASPPPTTPPPADDGSGGDAG